MVGTKPDFGMLPRSMHALCNLAAKGEDFFPHRRQPKEHIFTPERVSRARHREEQEKIGSSSPAPSHPPPLVLLLFLVLLFLVLLNLS